MIFRNIHENSPLPKSLIIVAMAISVGISYYLMFVGRNDLVQWAQQYKITGDFYRRLLLFLCFVIYCIRLGITLFFFFRRKMYWIEAIMITNIMPFIIPYIAFVGGKNNHQLGLIESIGIIFFLFGSYLNTRSEYLRYIWKKKEENKGCVYTDGLFKYAIHINYLGDIVLFTGLAMIGNALILLIIPGSMAFIFIAILIPLKETYLENKYGNEFIDYMSKTKKLIPWIY
ncbi:MAG: DUF1295 domain-containing protein [Desulfobacterales bacterium]|nr:DUF1295 domain-containing protein [Desulfobacterales bacterium]